MYLTPWNSPYSRLIKQTFLDTDKFKKEPSNTICLSNLQPSNNEDNEEGDNMAGNDGNGGVAGGAVAGSPAPDATTAAAAKAAAIAAAEKVCTYNLTHWVG